MGAAIKAIFSIKIRCLFLEAEKLKSLKNIGGDYSAGAAALSDSLDCNFCFTLGIKDEEVAQICIVG